MGVQGVQESLPYFGTTFAFGPEGDLFAYGGACNNQKLTKYRVRSAEGKIQLAFV